MTPPDAGLLVNQDWRGRPLPEFELPPRLRLLCIGLEEPSWVGLTLQLDAEDCVEPQFRWVSTAGEALNILRSESFDCILIGQPTPGGLSSSDRRTSELVRAIRAGGCDDPIVLLAPAAADEQWIDVFQSKCELLVSTRMWESPALVPMIKRAIANVQLARDNHHLALSNQRRLVRERDEAEQLMNQQRQMIEELQSVSRRDAPSCGENRPTAPCAGDETASDSRAVGLPDQIGAYYQELLRTYVIMGSGSLGGEIAGLAEVLSVAGLSPRETLELHLERVEVLVRGLGNRSARHVMARADLLALELMVHLGECYQRGIGAQ
jgi:hypothetical protein